MRQKGAEWQRGWMHSATKFLDQSSFTLTRLQAASLPIPTHPPTSEVRALSCFLNAVHPLGMSKSKRYASCVRMASTNTHRPASMVFSRRSSIVKRACEGYMNKQGQLCFGQAVKSVPGGSLGGSSQVLRCFVRLRMHSFIL